MAKKSPLFLKAIGRNSIRACNKNLELVYFSQMTPQVKTVFDLGQIVVEKNPVPKSWAAPGFYMVVGKDGDKLECMQVAYGDEGEILHQLNLSKFNVEDLQLQPDQKVEGHTVTPRDIGEIFAVSEAVRSRDEGKRLRGASKEI